MDSSDIADLAAAMMRLHGNARALVLADKYAAEASAKGDARGFLRWSGAAERIAEIMQAQKVAARNR